MKRKFSMEYHESGNLTFYYPGPIDSALDDKIKSLAWHHGYEWYGQGLNLITNERDISFKETQTQKENDHG